MKAAQSIQPSEDRWQSLYPMGGISAVILLLYSLATMVILFATGGQPETIQETFQMLRENRVVGLLRLDLLTVYIMPLYYILFLSLWAALKRFHLVNSTLATILVLAGLTIFLASPSVFSYLILSDRYAAAAAQAQRDQLLAAGEAIYATDLWHGTGALIGGILIQSGAVLISVIMLRGGGFAKATAVVGIVTHGLDLAHLLVIPFAPGVAAALMYVGGTLYLLWFPLIAWDLFRLQRKGKEQLQQSLTTSG